MLTPIRCITCGSSIGDIAPFFQILKSRKIEAALTERDTNPNMAIVDAGLQVECKDILESLGVKYDCCRMHLISTMQFNDYY